MAFGKKDKNSIEQKTDSFKEEQKYKEIIDEKNKSILGALGNINEILQFITKFDYVKEMVLDAAAESEMLETIAASSEEMAVATEDISNYVQESNENMIHAMNETESSLEKVDRTFKEVENNISEIDAVKGIMNEVVTETTKINELVNVIKSVADQTNLLSLNASIEAARAGEHGRGFAVVADEIKKLAESTKNQVDIIRKIVKELNEKIERATGEIDRVVGTFSDSKVAIEDATAGIQKIGVKMNAVKDSFTSISANIQEQTATSEEMSSSLQIMNEKSAKISAEADQTGKAFFDISQKVDKLRLMAIGSAGTVDQSTMVELTVTDHLMWKWRVYNMILGNVKLDTGSVGDHNGCRLGKWLATLDQKDSKISGIISRLEQPHGDVHRLALRAIQEFNSGNKSAAEKTLVDIEKSSDQVVSLLAELKRSL